MKLTFATAQDGSYYTLSNDGNNYGYTLTKWTPTKKEDAKKEYTQSSLFYATLEQAAEKVAYLELQGHTLDELLVSYNQMIENITKTLKGATECQ
jgi:hypothetical protein